MNGKRILIPVKLPDGPLDALQFAQGLAGEVPIHLTLLNVVDLNIVRLENRVYRGVCTENEAALKKLAKDFFGDDPLVSVNVRVGRPPEEIVAEAEAELSELIIMVSPQPSRWKQLFGLDTVERVVRNARCPTLVLPRILKITPEQYRQAMRARNNVQSAVAWQPDAALLRL